MCDQGHVRVILDTAIIIGYSAFAFVVMPLVVFAVWVSEQRGLSAEKA